MQKEETSMTRINETASKDFKRRCRKNWKMFLVKKEDGEVYIYETL